MRRELHSPSVFLFLFISELKHKQQAKQSKAVQKTNYQVTGPARLYCKTAFPSEGSINPAILLFTRRATSAGQKLPFANRNRAEKKKKKCRTNACCLHRNWHFSINRCDQPSRGFVAKSLPASCSCCSAPSATASHSLSLPAAGRAPAGATPHHAAKPNHGKPNPGGQPGYTSSPCSPS